MAARDLTPECQEIYASMCRRSKNHVIPPEFVTNEILLRWKNKTMPGMMAALDMAHTQGAEEAVAFYLYLVEVIGPLLSPSQQPLIASWNSMAAFWKQDVQRCLAAGVKYPNPIPQPNATTNALHISPEASVCDAPTDMD